MSFPEVVQYSLAGLFMTSLALGFSLAVQVRCIAFLTVPTFFGKTGRGYVGAFALTYLLMGEIYLFVYTLYPIYAPALFLYRVRHVKVPLHWSASASFTASAYKSLVAFHQKCLHWAAPVSASAISIKSIDFTWRPLPSAFSWRTRTRWRTTRISVNAP